MRVIGSSCAPNVCPAFYSSLIFFFVYPCLVASQVTQALVCFVGYPPRCLIRPCRKAVRISGFVTASRTIPTGPRASRLGSLGALTLSFDSIEGKGALRRTPGSSSANLLSPSFLIFVFPDFFFRQLQRFAFDAICPAPTSTSIPSPPTPPLHC